MAYTDYYHCDVCKGKTFYDACVDYAAPTIEDLAGYSYVGDMKVICPTCAKGWEVHLQPRTSDLPIERYEEWVRIATAVRVKFAEYEKVSEMKTVRMKGKRKQMVNLRLEPDLLEWFRATGPGYQARMAEALEEYRRKVL